MTARPCFIGIDIGTSTCKTLALDADGAVVAHASADYPLVTPRPGWAEQDPELWWQAAAATVSAVTAQLGAHCVEAIGLTGQMHGLVPLDEEDRVIRPAMLWCDQRAAPQCQALTRRVGGLPALLALSSNRMLPGFTGGKFLWLAEHEPDAFARMRRFLNPKDYLRLRMTGVHATDVSDASGTGLLDVRRRRWSPELLAAAGLTDEQVPDVFESTEVTGGLAPEVAAAWGLPAGLPVVAGGGDSVLQTTSQGIVEAGSIGITIGTAGIVGGAARRCPDNPGGLVQVSCGNAPDRWHVMGVSLNAGGSFQWLKETLEPLAHGELGFDRLAALAGSAPAGAAGLMFLPYLMGERCPHVAPDGRGAWVGLTRGHGLGHMARAVMEGALLNMRAILDLFAEAGLACDRLRASGGATASRVWLELLADVAGRPVATVSGASEGGAFGAALLAGVGAGHWPSLDAAVGVVHETGRVDPDPGRARVYDAIHPIHKSLYATLRATFAELAMLPDAKASA
ncbi:xylulokinase [Labrys wisconsinensis]|uniref:Xylulose kinase n=1 Tax=Labrys wisconsinensis TaxID=425677 RepID=A0ABU0JAP7_9HYPH|nr:xylulokinase [Labrys wisconsinensis]MDQ0471342.1 xylulokinase [Labrys wisconsinensis]